MNNNLIVVEQKEVAFYDDELSSVRADDGQIYVSVRHMCNALGIQRPQRQTDRIKRDEVLSDGLQRVPIMGTRGRQQSYVLRVDLVPLWLTGIEVSRVDETAQKKIIQYKREAAKVLWEAFQEGRLTADPTFDDLLAGDSAAAQAFRMAQAVMSLARSQLLIESRVTAVEGRLEEIATQLADPGRKVTPSQATNISQAVKAVAMALSKASGRNEYGGVYGELYRRYEVPSYRELPASKYDDVMAWLNEWLQSITGDQPF